MTPNPDSHAPYASFTVNNNDIVCIPGGKGYCGSFKFDFNATGSMDKDGDMPFVEELKASGDPLAPIISWKAPNEKDIPKGVTVEYRVRLLKDSLNQLYRSESISNTQHQIPEGKIKSEDLSDIYVRVECSGLDKDDSDHPVALELRSETIKPLKEALGK